MPDAHGGAGTALLGGGVCLDTPPLDPQRYREMEECLKQIKELCTPRPERPGGNHMVVGKLVLGLITAHGLG